MHEKTSDGFAFRSFITCDDFMNFISSQQGSWIYRGQSEDWSLKTSLERMLSTWNIDLPNAAAIEKEMIRDFRRLYRGRHKTEILGDTLYCLSVMQHHHAPTRLLDWTYSAFVAAKFAMEAGGKHAVIWSMNTDWCDRAAAEIAPELPAREDVRTDGTFLPIYMPDGERRKFVKPDNPFFLNERLTIQQGVFICVGDVTISFLDNLRAMTGWDLQENLLKSHLELEIDRAYEFSRRLIRMNISSAALFPGLDGFARSLGERAVLYRDLADIRVASKK